MCRQPRSREHPARSGARRGLGGFGELGPRILPRLQAWATDRAVMTQTGRRKQVCRQLDAPEATVLAAIPAPPWWKYPSRGTASGEACRRGQGLSEEGVGRGGVDADGDKHARGEAGAGHDDATVTVVTAEEISTRLTARALEEHRQGAADGAPVSLQGNTL